MVQWWLTDSEKLQRETSTWVGYFCYSAMKSTKVARIFISETCKMINFNLLICGYER